MKVIWTGENIKAKKGSTVASFFYVIMVMEIDQHTSASDSYSYFISTPCDKMNYH